MKNMLVRLIAVLASFACLNQCADAATVTFTNLPAVVSNTYAGTITLQIGGLTNTEKVVVQKFLDLNANGIVDGGDLLVQQFGLTDGQSGMVIGGVTNFNVPGDLNAATGVITATLNFRDGDFMQNITGNYLYVLSSPAGHFAPITNSFNVTSFPFLQQFTGNVVSNGTSATVSNVVVMLFPAPRAGHSSPDGYPAASAVADSAGNYTIAAPPGTYVPLAFGSNYIGNFSASPVLTLAAGQTITTNLTLTNATSSLVGSVVDANNSNKRVPGVWLHAMSSQGLLAITLTDTNGNFTMPADAGTWNLNADETGLIVHGYVGLQNGTNVTGGATGVTLTYSKATALFYGSVTDSQGNPLPGLDVSGNDNDNFYEADGYTDANGNYVAGVLGGLGGDDPWQIDISSSTTLTNYILTQPAFDSNNGTNVNANTVVLASFTALLATNSISGTLADNSGNPIAGVGIGANATINGNNYQAYVDTDTNGSFTLNVANGTWSVAVSSGGGDGLSGSYFSPVNQFVIISNNNAVVNFTAVKATNSISGSLTDNYGNPISGVGIWAFATINGASYNPGAITDTNGNYSFAVVAGDWSVNVSNGGDSNPLADDYLAPPGQTVVITNNNATVDFTTLLATNSISGTLTDNNGNPIAGVGIGANATINGNNYQAYVDTDTNGSFTLNVANGTWSVAVSSGGGDGLSGSYLQPDSQTMVISNSNGALNFTAILATNQISGYLKDNHNQPVAAVRIWAYANINGVDYYQGSLQDTDTNGNYSLNVANGSWSVWVSLEGGSDILPLNYLSPDSQSLVISNNNAAVNFTVLLATQNISGHVQLSNGSPVAGVGVWVSGTINGTNYSQYEDTGTNGNYTLGAVNGFWNINFNSSSGSDSLDGLLGSGNYQNPGSQNVTITNNNGTADFTILLCGGIQILTTNLPSGQVNSHYDQFLQASSCSSTFTWSVVSGSLPPGLTANPATGEISGIPTNAGTYIFTVQVTDGNSLTTNQSLSLYIAPATVPLQVTTTSLANATQNAAYSTNLTAIGGQPPYTWLLMPGSASLPAGLSLATNGVISGTPIGIGTSQFIVTVTDATAAWTYQILSLTVSPSSLPQAITLAVVGRSGSGAFEFSFKIAAGVTYTVQSSTDLKTWAAYETFNFSNSVPASGGRWTVTVPATASGQCFYRVKVGS
jgi:hypothetical protein